MEYSLFVSLALILVTASLLGECASYFKIPPVFGELLAGIILGPSLLNWIQPSTSLTMLAELGLVFLLFEIGFTTKVTELINKWYQSCLVAFAGIFLPFILGFLVSYYVFNLSLLVSLFIGGTLTATSIGITLRVFRDLKKQQSPEANIVLGAAVLDDIIGIIILAVVVQFAISGKIDLYQAGTDFLSVMVFLIATPVLAWLYARWIQKTKKINHLPGTFIIALILIYMWITDKMNIPDLLAGFAIGLAFSPHSFVPRKYQDPAFFERINRQTQPIFHIFIPIFFVLIGLSLNLREIMWGSAHFWGFSSLLLLVAILGKLASGWFLLKTKSAVRWAVGLAMIPRGEVGLVFAALGKEKGVFDNEIYAIIIIIVTVTTLMTPLALKSFYKITRT